MVTAVIVNYRCHRLTARAAASVLADQPDAQVIVVDNSADPLEAQALQAVLPHQTTCLIAPENLGFGKACNLGFEQARHDWIFLLNPDAWVLPGCIRTLVDFFVGTPQAAAAAPLTWWDTEQQWLLPPAQLPTPVTELGLFLALRHPRLGNLVSRRFRQWALGCLSTQRPVPQKMLSGGVVMLRRSAVVAAGGLFDPDFFMYYEDTDLCVRLHKAGFQLYLVPQAQAVHAWESDGGKGELAAGSRLLYFQKQFPGSLLFGLCQRLERCKSELHLPPSQQLGVCQEPPQFAVSPELQKAWVLEISPHPLLVPALYCFGRGGQAQIAEQVWALLGGGEYWARLGSPEGNGLQRFRFSVAERGPQIE